MKIFCELIITSKQRIFFKYKQNFRLAMMFNNSIELSCFDVFYSLN